MRPGIVSLGKRLALHMVNEDKLFRQIAGSCPTEDEAVFLATCIFRRSGPTTGWKLMKKTD